MKPERTSMSFAKFREAKDSGQPAGAETAATARREGSSAGSAAAQPPGEALIGAGSKIVGKLTFEGPAQIDGEVEGEVVSKDKLVIGEGAVVNAKVVGSDILVKGVVTGDIVAARSLALQRPARIRGNISCPSLHIEEGVVFDGTCRMNASEGGAACSTTSGGVATAA
jgi:cytoskeletal protein CcmA (bactofilin family)